MRLPAAKFLALLLLWSSMACAVDGQITNLSGAVVAKRSEGQTRILSLKSAVSEGDIIATSVNSYVRIKFTDGAEIVLRPNTQLKIDAYKYSEQPSETENMAVSLLKGGLRTVTGLLGRRNPGAFKLSTPNATIGIRGTHFGALFCSSDCAGVTLPGGGAAPNGLHVDVADGVIVVSTKAGSAEFRVGQTGYVASANVPPVVVPPQQGIRVTLPPQSSSTQTQPGSAGGVGRGSDQECAIK